MTKALRVTAGPAPRGVPNDDPGVSISRNGWSRRAAPWVTAILLVTGAAWAMTSSGSQLSESLRYLGVWLVLIWLPGVLVWRLVVGRTRTEIELGGGAVVGISLFLFGWVAATLLGSPRLAVVPACVVLLATVMAPRLRTVWRAPAPRAEAGPGWWAAIGALGLLSIYKVSLSVLQPSALPPGPSQIAPDTWFSIGLAQQLAVGLPPQDPTNVGGLVTYHWFPLGVLTGTAQIAGTDFAATVMHLWFPPFVVLWLCVVSALTRTLLLPYEADHPAVRWSGWGPLAALLVVPVSGALVLTPAPGPGLGSGLNSSSASGAFGGVFVAGLSLLAILVARGAPRRTVALMVAVAVTGSGVKPTVLPLVVAGCVVASLGLLLTRRRWFPTAAAGVLSLVIFGLAARVVIGSTEGSRIQPFGIVAGDVGYRELFAPGPVPPPASGGVWLPALSEGRPGAWILVVGVLALFLAGQMLRLLGVIALPWSPLRRDPGAWFCAGAVVSGYTATFLLAHTGLSQQWFALNVSGVSVALTTAAVALAVPARLSALASLVVVLTVFVGVAAALLAGRLVTPETGVGTRLGLAERLTPYVVVVAVLVGWVLLSRVVPTLHPAARLGTFALAGGLLAGAALPAGTAWLREHEPIPITTGEASLVTADQQRASLWIRDHTPPEAVVVSNIFCRPVAYRATCDHTSVWASALSGRRFVLDGWAYSPRSMAQFDGSAPWSRLPSPWPDRLRLSLELVQKPDRDIACSLVERFRAGWVLVDENATPVSPRLADVGEVRYRSGPVAVYRLRDGATLGCGSA